MVECVSCRNDAILLSLFRCESSQKMIDLVGHTRALVSLQRLVPQLTQRAVQPQWQRVKRIAWVFLPSAGRSARPRTPPRHAAAQQ
jgi:hypothetical protein